MNKKRSRCLPCKIEKKINYSIIEVDNIPMCKHHYEIWKEQFKEIEAEYEDIED